MTVIVVCVKGIGEGIDPLISYQEEGGGDDDERRDEAGEREVHGSPPSRLGVLLHHPLVMVDTSVSNPGQVGLDILIFRV